MTDTPDWTKPETLELWNRETGETHGGVFGEFAYEGYLWRCDTDHAGNGLYYLDGNSYDDDDPWRIRNKPEAAPAIPREEELYEAMKQVVLAGKGAALPDFAEMMDPPSEWAVSRLREFASDVAAALDALNKPVDPLELALADAATDVPVGDFAMMAERLRAVSPKHGLTLAIGKGDAS